MAEDTGYIRNQLRNPFRPDELEWRVGRTAGQGEKVRVLALGYVQARAIQNRLDKVLGIENWYDCYEPGPAGGVKCSLSIRIGGEWITKEGLADNSQVEPVKGGESDSLKRAAYKFGIGRYLYELPDVWCEAVVRGKTAVLAERPSLPEWAYPEDWKGEKEKANTKVVLLSAAEVAALTYKQTPEGVSGRGQKPVATTRNPAPAVQKPVPAAEVKAETPAAEETKAEAPADVKEQEALNRAYAYVVPTGHKLPNEGQTLKQVLDTSPAVGRHLLRILSDRVEGLQVKPFAPTNDAEKKVVSAAAFLLDHLPEPAK